MLMKPDHTPVNSSAALPAAAACGDCGVEVRRLLHHVRHRGIFRRLCTTCVLRLHSQFFCPTCLQVYLPAPPKDAILTCVKCSSSTHSQCVAVGHMAPPSDYVCSLCVPPNTPIFKLKSAKEAGVVINEAVSEDSRVMDIDAAKKLLTAAKIASFSMNKAAVATKAEAERRAKDAAFTRKRAREALEHVAFLVIKEKMRKKEAAPGEVSGPELNGVGANPGYLCHRIDSMKVERENNANVSISNKNGSAAPPCIGEAIVMEKRINCLGDADRANDSNHMLAALVSDELREKEKMGEGAESGLPLNDDHAAMVVDEEEGVTLRAGKNVEGMVGERINCRGGNNMLPGYAERIALNLPMEEKKIEDVNNEAALDQPPRI